MPEKSGSDPLYNEQDIGRILSKAFRLQQDPRTGDGPASGRGYGLSLQEIQHVAAEFGIDARNVEMAAAGLAEETPPARPFHFWGGPMAVSSERIVQGELTEEAWHDVVAELRKTFGGVGRTAQVGSAWEWTCDHNSGAQTFCSVSPRAGQVKISLTSDANELRLYLPLALGFCLFLSTLLALTLGQESSPAMSAVLLAALAVLSYALLLAVFSSYTKRRARRVKRAATQIAGILTRQAASPAPVAPVALPDATAPSPVPDREDAYAEPAPLRHRNRVEG